jgi:arylsulfatase A-like enzyme
MIVEASRSYSTHKIVKKSLMLMFLFTLAGLLSCKRQKEHGTRQPGRPNILFIMSDDHAFRAISAYSDELIQTPNIDRIANEGMLFTNASVTNSVCGPSRAVILTGTYNHINGKIDNISSFDTTQLVFPQLLQDADYQTAMFGKLHFGNKPRGMDEYKILPGHGHYYNSNYITKNEGKIKVEGYTTDIITDMTLEWLEKDRDPDRPFLLMYLHKAPHRQWLPAPRHFRKYTKMTFPEPDNLFDDYENRGTAARTAEMNILHHMSYGADNKIYPEVIEELGIDDQDIVGLDSVLGGLTPEQREAWDQVFGPINEDFKKRYPEMSEEDLMRWKYQRYMQDYLGSVAAIDEGVGKVLDYLDEEGLCENTIVVYTSDQGFFLGEHGWFDKRFSYRESFNTPLLIRWPGVIEPGSVNEQLVQNLDFAPTLLGAAGLDIPGQMQGESMVPLFRGDTDSWREAVLYHYYEYPSWHMVKRHYGIVTKKYKLIHFYYDVDEWELYDLEKDSTEMNNVYNDPAYATVIAELKVQLTSLRKKYGDMDEFVRESIELYEERGFVLPD